MAPAKKSQPQKMSLGDFLTDESLGSWADEMENMPALPTEPRAGYGERRAFSTSDRFGSGFNDRGSFAREQLPLPDKPPYTAHIGNLSFDVTETEVTNFFQGCSVTHVRIVEDKVERKPKGFGYAEFASLEGLKKALALNNEQFSGRNIRISVAEPQKDRQEGRDISDWTRKGPLPSLPTEQRRVSERTYSSRNYDNASDAGSERADRRRQPFDQNDGKVRDFGNWERKGPLSPLPPSGPPSGNGSRPRTQDGPRNRRHSPAWGEGRSQDGSRPPRREIHDRPQADRAPTAPEMDNQWRSKMRPDRPAKSPTSSRETSNPPSPAPPAPAQMVRPKLNLQKRTVSEAETTSPASAVSDAKSSPFGAARPIDTTAREKEVEERRQLALRQKKEQEEKAREEKAREEKIRNEKREERRGPKGGPKAEKITTKSEPNDNSEENGAVQPSKNYEILRNADEGEGNEAEAEDDGEDADNPNGAIVEDKEVKPNEVLRDIPTTTNKDAWRAKSDNGGPNNRAETATDAMEGEGWSMVSKAKNSRKGMNQAARAIAS